MKPSCGAAGGQLGRVFLDAWRLEDFRAILGGENSTVIYDGGSGVAIVSHCEFFEVAKGY